MFQGRTSAAAFACWCVHQVRVHERHCSPRVAARAFARARFKLGNPSYATVGGVFHFSGGGCLFQRRGPGLIGPGIWKVLAYHLGCGLVVSLGTFGGSVMQPGVCVLASRKRHWLILRSGWRPRAVSRPPHRRIDRNPSNACCSRLIPGPLARSRAVPPQRWPVPGHGFFFFCSRSGSVARFAEVMVAVIEPCYLAMIRRDLTRKDVALLALRIRGPGGEDPALVPSGGMCPQLPRHHEARLCSRT